ncbi:MAG: DapH/DapD/GlmU-related protein [Bacteroidota bacterium]
MGPDTIIGNDVTIGPWVVIGHNFDDKYPTIEDDCYIGPKATLLGGITIGRGSKIGTNAVVTKDLDPYSQVVSLNRMISSSDYSE